MRRVALFACLALLGGCGGQNAQRAMEQEHDEIAACIATYPPGKAELMPLVRCKLGAAAEYVQQMDAPENRTIAKLSDELEKAAAEVDAGRMTIADWNTMARQRVDALPQSDKRTRLSVDAIL